MTNDGQLRQTVLQVIGEIAPEAELGSLDPQGDLREQLDLDSMDVLNLAIGLYEATGIEIPERDYPKIVTLNGCVDYLASAAAAPPPR